MRHGKKRSTAGVSFSLAEHEVAGPIGLNGAGKTTVMKITESIGMAGCTAVDIQLAGSGSDETVSAIRSLFPADSSIADKRLSNSESQSSYYTGAVFIYGFLVIIALITVFMVRYRSQYAAGPYCLRGAGLQQKNPGCILGLPDCQSRFPRLSL